MAIKSLYAGEQLAVVADGNEDLRVGSNRSLEDREGAGGEFVFLELRNFVLPFKTS